MGQRISVKPKDAETGGAVFGFPVGSVVTVTDARWTTWAEAGEKALTKGRDPKDPALYIEGEVEGMEELQHDMLAAGKYTRLQPSDDGEFLETAEGSSATGMADSCNAQIFIRSLCDTAKHGKLAVDEETFDDGMRGALTGLKFVAGRVVVQREGLEKTRPTLVADQVLGFVKTAGKTKGKAATEDDSDVVEAAEACIVKALASPKYSKGIPLEKAFVVGFPFAKGSPHQKSITQLFEDADWLSDETRPWEVKKGLIVSAV